MKYAGHAAESIRKYMVVQIVGQRIIKLLFKGGQQMPEHGFDVLDLIPSSMICRGFSA